MREVARGTTYQPHCPSQDNNTHQVEYEVKKSLRFTFCHISLAVRQDVKDTHQLQSNFISAIKPNE